MTSIVNGSSRRVTDECCIAPKGPSVYWGVRALRYGLQPFSDSTVTDLISLGADPAWLEPAGCSPGLPIDMGHAARMVRLPRSAKADSERAQRATFNAKPSTDFPESVRNIQLGITSLKRVVRLIPGVVKNSRIIQV